MPTAITCTCGNVLRVSDDLAGSCISCSCGHMIPVLGLPEPPAPAITDALPPPSPSVQVPSESAPGRHPPEEVLAPTPVWLRDERGGLPRQVMAALTADALWIQDTWQLRRIPLSILDSIEVRQGGTELILSLRPEPSTDRLTLTFASAGEGEDWHRQLQTRQLQPTADATWDDRRMPEGVSLVRHAADVPHEILGQVEFTGHTAWAADRGLQLRAGMWGGDAVLGVYRHKSPDLEGGGRHAQGAVIRVADADARKRLRLRWYAEEVRALFNRMLLLLVLQAAMLFLSAVVFAGASKLEVPTGETTSEALVSAGWALALVSGWPLVMLVLLRLLRWPQLLRATGVAVLAATTGRAVVVWLGHFAAAATTPSAQAGSGIWMLIDPFAWAIVIFGGILCRRAWRLAGDARQILPPEAQAVPAARLAWAWGLLVVSSLYALAFLALVGFVRYQSSADMLQPGVDPRREQQALLALNEGANQANKGEFGSAEQSLQRSLRLWEDLTRARTAPVRYRANLALTLYNLGWIRQKQGRQEDAEKYYARAVSIADDLGDAVQGDETLKQTMAYARAMLAEWRDNQRFKVMDEKDQAAQRKYEEALVKADKGDKDAEVLYQEVIATWEEILPQATNEQYRKDTVIRLGSAHLRLGDLQQQLGKRTVAEATLKKGIDYWEKAVAREPERQLCKHNLEVTRQRLEELREQAFQDEITKLCDANRFAEARDRWRRGIQEQEEQLRLGAERDAAERRLAYRLHRFAWFLAHCPDVLIRDKKAALQHARRATELQPDVGEYWYTLATVEYRNGHWRQSLGSLEKVKARSGGFEASDWFLVAMNRHQLKEKDAARAAWRQGVESLADLQRKAENNAPLRIQYELRRPALEALRQEAESLLEGKEAANQGG